VHFRDVLLESFVLFNGLKLFEFLINPHETEIFQILKVRYSFSNFSHVFERFKTTKKYKIT
jgi:hypothetical protein